MKLAALSFTRAGGVLCGQLCQALRDAGMSCEGYINKRYMDELGKNPWIHALDCSVSEWTGRQFSQTDGLIYIGAAGIAVRAVAPFLKDKWTDPAVVVADELGRYVIPVLSGHIGGANRLAEQIAAFLHAVLVVTTASEVNGRTAIDVWAADHGLKIADRQKAKQIAMELLDGREVGIFIEDGLAPAVFPGIRTEEDICLPEGCRTGVFGGRNAEITIRRHGRDAEVLRLVPGIVSVGIGCRKDVSLERLRAVLLRAFAGQDLDPLCIARFSSISRKRNEPGIIALAEELGVPFVTFSADELSRVPGSFTDSAFVGRTVGIGNVCERAAVAAAGGSRGEMCGVRLLIRKWAEDGVTVAAAVPDCRG